MYELRSSAYYSNYQNHLFLKMFLKSSSAIILAVTLSICVKAETHTVVFNNMCVAFVLVA